MPYHKSVEADLLRALAFTEASVKSIRDDLEAGLSNHVSHADILRRNALQVVEHARKLANIDEAYWRAHLND